MLLHFIAFWPFDLKPKFSNRTFIETTPQINEYYFHSFTKTCNLHLTILSKKVSKPMDYRALCTNINSPV